MSDFPDERDSSSILCHPVTFLIISGISLSSRKKAKESIIKWGGGQGGGNPGVMEGKREKRERKADIQGGRGAGRNGKKFRNLSQESVSHPLLP